MADTSNSGEGSGSSYFSAFKASDVDFGKLTLPTASGQEGTNCNRQLYDEVRKGAAADLDVVQRCVRAGANPLYIPAGGKNTTLHYAFLESNVEALKTILEASPCIINYSVSGVDGRSPLHCIFQRTHGSEPPRHTPEAMREMTTALVKRLATHPKDRVGWGVKDCNGMDFLSSAAKEGVLSDLYPLVKHQAYYTRAAKPMVLAFRPSTEDWAKLSEADQNELLRPSEEESISRQLYDELRIGTAADLDVVRRCVRAGADPLYSPADTTSTTLHFTLFNRNVEALRILLETPKELDFTVTGINRQTPLHCVCGYFAYPSSHSPEKMKAMLAAILDRLSSHPNDRVDWSLKAKDCRDFLNLSAKEGVLSDLYPLVKDLPYYKSAARPIVLGVRPRDEDWAKLSEADQQQFYMPAVV